MPWVVEPNCYHNVSQNLSANIWVGSGSILVFGFCFETFFVVIYVSCIVMLQSNTHMFSLRWWLCKGVKDMNTFVH